MNKQRKWQLEKIAEGLCQICGMPASTSSHCVYHAQKHNGYCLARYYRNRQSKQKSNSRLEVKKFMPKMKPKMSSRAESG